MWLVKHYNPITRIGIFRVARDSAKILWGGIAFLIRILNERAKIRVIDFKATIKKIEISFRRKMNIWLHTLIKDGNLMEEEKLKLREAFEKHSTKFKPIDI